MEGIWSVGSQCKEIMSHEKRLKGKIYRPYWLNEYGGVGEQRYARVCTRH